MSVRSGDLQLGVAGSFDKADCLVNCRHLFGSVIRDLTAELVFERQHQLYTVKTVSPEIAHEPGVISDPGLVDAEMRDDNLLTRSTTPLIGSPLFLWPYANRPSPINVPYSPSRRISGRLPSRSCTERTGQVLIN